MLEAPDANEPAGNCSMSQSVFVPRGTLTASATRHHISPLGEALCAGCYRVHLTCITKVMNLSLHKAVKSVLHQL